MLDREYLQIVPNMSVQWTARAPQLLVLSMFRVWVAFVQVVCCPACH